MGYVWKATLNGAPHTSAVYGLCKRVRFRKNRCQRCLELCPEQAITFNPGPHIGHGCSDCGLCLNSCPTDVFRNEFHSDRYLVDQAVSLLGKKRFAGGRKRLLISCHRAQRQNGNVLPVRCLGRITENVVLGAAFSGFDEIQLTRGICSRCHLRQGEKLLVRSLAVARSLLETMGWSRPQIRLHEEEKEREEVFSRREMLSRISDIARNKTASMLYQREKSVREALSRRVGGEVAARPSPRRDFLLELLREKKWANPAEMKYEPQSPWGKVIIDENKCSACGICHFLCPTGALRRESLNGNRHIYFGGSRCTNCMLCQEACPEQAIGFKDTFLLSDIVRDEDTLVAGISPASCTA